MPFENKVKATDDMAAYMRAWRAKNPEKVKEYSRRQSQSPKKKEYNRIYKEAHREEVKAYSKNKYCTMSMEQKMAECAKRKKRYREDPEWAERIRTRNRERARRLKAEKLKEAQNNNIESGVTASDSQRDLPLSSIRG